MTSFSVPANKRRIIACASVILICFVLCLLAFLVADFADAPMPFSIIGQFPIGSFLFKIICLAGCLFLGYGAIDYFGKIVRDDDELFSVDNGGLFDNTTALSIGFIPWCDVNDIYVKGKFLCVSILDEEAYLANENIVKRAVMMFNKKTGYEIVCISFIGTGYDVRYVFQEIQRFL